MNDTHPLWPRMNRALNQLELTSETSSPNPNATGGGKPGSRVLTFTAMPDHLYWLREWQRALTDPAKLRAVEGAEAALRAITHSQAGEEKPESAEERDARILHPNNEGVEPAALAVALYGHVTVRMVTDARKQAGLDPLTGRAWKQGEDNRAKARRLMDSGMSLRQTATVLGLHMEQLRRLMREAA